VIGTVRCSGCDAENNWSVPCMSKNTRIDAQCGLM
jgi:hypothetical protein